LAANLLRYDPTTIYVTYLFCLNMMFSSVCGVFVGALQGVQEQRIIAIVSVLSKGALFGLSIILLVSGHGLVGLAIAWSVSSGIAVFGYLLPLLRRGMFRGPLDRSTWPRLIAGSAPFFVWQAALMVYGQIDIILLAIFTRDEVIGWYVAAYRILSIAMFAPTIISGVSFPALSESVYRAPARFLAIARQSLRIVVILTVPVAVGSIVVAEDLLEFLHYPDEFRHSIPIIAILGIHVPIASADIVIGTVLMARDKQRIWALTGVAAAVLNPAINLLLIPYFDNRFGNGAIGAATATVLTELFMMAMGLRLLKGSVFDRGSLMVAVRSVAAAVIMAGVVMLMRGLFLPLTVAVGALVYLLASLAFGTISLRDFRLLRGYVRNRATARPVTTV
jgi:O-antigen/teichoic acid export membrane protein